MDIAFTPRKVLFILLMIISFLLFAHISGFIAKHYFHLNEIKIISGIIGTFDLIKERNVPTLYSSTSLFVSSILLLIITVKQKSMGYDYIGWLGLTLIFLFLSYDEVASIHERFTKIFRGAYHTSGLLYYAWVIPYGTMVIIFALAYLRFLLRLPKKFMILFVVSGTVFVTGAIGFEMWSGLHEDNDLIYATLYTMEELFEMLGIALFIYALLQYISEKFDHLTITIQQ